MSVNEDIFNGAAYFFEKYAMFAYENGASGMFATISILLEAFNTLKDGIEGDYFTI